MRNTLIDYFYIENQSLFMPLGTTHKIKICKEFINMYHRLPTGNETYKGFNVGFFVSCIPNMRKSILKSIIIKSIINELQKFESPESISKTSGFLNNKFNHIYKLQLCKEYFDVYHKIPSNKITYKCFAIGRYIRNPSLSKFTKDKIKEIFGTVPQYNNFNTSLELCKLFNEEYHRFPNYKDKKYKGVNLYSFVKARHKPDEENEIAKVFGIDYHTFKSSVVDENKLKMCKEYYEVNQCLPGMNDKIGNFRIGNFIYSFRRGYNTHLKDKVEEIFGVKFGINGQAQDLYTDRYIINICKCYLAEFNRFPISKTEKYKSSSFHIGDFMYRIHKCESENLKTTIKAMFGDLIPKIIGPYDSKIAGKIKLCEEYYSEYHVIPSWNETIKGFGIGAFIKQRVKKYNKMLSERRAGANHDKLEFETAESIVENLNIIFETDLQKHFDLKTAKSLQKNDTSDINSAVESLIKLLQEYGIEERLINNLAQYILDDRTVGYTLKLTRKLKLCMDYYSQHKSRPSTSARMEGIRIGDLINCKEPRHLKYVAPIIDVIFDA